MSSHRCLRTNPLFSLPIILLILVTVLLVSCGDDDIVNPTEDREPPATTKDLSIDSLSSGSIRLVWTAPGDDSITGQAAQYDIRYSTSELDSSSWSSATSCTNPHTPAIAGTVESFAVTGLDPMTKYYFALRTSDESHNWSSVSNAVSAKTPDSVIITWERTYGGPHQELLGKVVVAPDGGYVMAGQTSSYGSGYSDVYLLKVDEYGEIVWQAVYGGGMSDDAWDVAVTPDGGYITAGSTGFSGDFLLDALIVKFDGNGHVIWGRTYDNEETSMDWAFSIASVPDGGYLVAGTATDHYGEEPLGYLWLLKINESGDVIWQQFHGIDMYPFSTLAAPDGGFVIVGSAPDVRLLKVDNSGEVVWDKVLGAELNAFDSRCVIVAVGGGYLVTGYTYTDITRDVYLAHVSESGDIIWERVYSSEGDTRSYSVIVAPDGGYIVAGRTKSPEAAYTDAYLMKVDGSGNLVWDRVYGGDYHDFAWSVAVTDDGGLIMGGVTQSFGAGGGDYYLLKLDANGNL